MDANKEAFLWIIQSQKRIHEEYIQSISQRSEQKNSLFCVYFFRHSGFYIPQIILKFMMGEDDNERAEWDWLKKK